jgi:hypothetical protein
MRFCHRPNAAVLLLTVALLACMGLTAAAQRVPPGGRPPEKPQMQPFAAEGTIQAIAPGKIGILTNTNQRWVVLVDPKAVIHVKGTAKADFLRVGQFVRFTAEIDKRGNVQGKLDKLALFTPSEDNRPGIWPEAAGGEGQNGFGVGAAAPAGEPQTARYTVAGQITGVRKGKLVVGVGRVAVQAELADDPAIDVDVSDMSLVHPGDKISITKGKMPPGQLGLAQAAELTVELSQPLTTARPKPVRPEPTRPEPTRPEPAASNKGA